MKRYVALLQGINVGGRRKVPMAELRTVLAELGWSDVRTHLNSGNAVFTADPAPAGEPAGRLEAALAARYGFAVPCLVRDAAALRGTVERCPYPVAELDHAKLLVYFLDAPADPARLAGLDPAAYAPEEFRLPEGERGENGEGAEIYAYFPQGSGRSRLGPALTRAFADRRATTRNWRTVTALLALVE